MLDATVALLGRIEANGLTLNVARAGPADGPMVLLLHGFPECWRGWERQIGPLAAAGLRVIAPDQRGYNLSDKPKGRRAYRLDTLADDAAALIAAEGRETAAVVGHDWGGIVAWRLAERHPGRVERLAILNAPNLADIRRHLLSRPRQLLKSWYVFAFQIPWLPEALARRRDWEFLANALWRTSCPGAFSDLDIARYKEAWSQPGAIRAMIDWYRANLWGGRPANVGRISVPGLILWGDQDTALQPALAEAGLARLPEGQLVHFPEATHWVHREEPERVNRLLIEFLAD